MYVITMMKVAENVVEETILMRVRLQDAATDNLSTMILTTTTSITNPTKTSL